MSTPAAPTAPTPPPRKLSASSVALWVLLVAVLGSAPSLLAVPVWMLHQPWITVPALLIVVISRFNPKALLTAALLGRQYVVQQRQSKTATA